MLTSTDPFFSREDFTSAHLLNFCAAGYFIIMIVILCNWHNKPKYRPKYSSVCDPFLTCSSSPPSFRLYSFLRFSLPTLLSNNQWGSTRWWLAVSCDTLSALTVWIYLSTAATRHSSELTFSRSLPTTSFALSIYLFIFRCVHLLPSTTQTMTTTTRIEPFVFHKIIIQRRCEHL